MVPLQVILGLGSCLQQVQDGQVTRGVPARLPELQQLLHAVPVQLHPLPAELDQGCFGRDQLLPLCLADHLAVDRQLVVVVDHRVQAEVAAGLRRGPLLARSDGCAQPDLHSAATLGSPPGRHHDRIAGVFEHPGAVFQEGEGLLQGEPEPDGLGRLQPAPDLRVNARGVAQAQQHVLVEVLAEAAQEVGPGGRSEPPVVGQAEPE